MLKCIVRNPALYAAPKGDKPPPLWIRGLLILTCTGVSFAHGSNDGQKGMGLIMLILIGTVPTAYALNRALPDSQIAAVRQQASQARRKRRSTPSGAGHSVIGDPRAGGDAATSPQRKINDGTYPVARGAGAATSASRCSSTARSTRCRPKPSATPATTCTSPRKRSAS